ncbi:MAG: hypothetical protein RQ729_03015 [Wenzhouxiangellaceae bacterium]|nr:hypothetical protein [Wenzhouxiangellaceae bacterium]
MTKQTWIALPLTAVLALTLTACGKDEPAAPETASSGPSMVERAAPRQQNQPAAQVSQDEDFRVMPRVEGQLDGDGMGLDVIIDASSKRAYAESLRWIAEDASKEQMASLERSIRFIHMYHPSVLGQEARMLDVINGKTGNEVIAMATEVSQKRRGG